jgi:hypothetical protein
MAISTLVECRAERPRIVKHRALLLLLFLSLTLPVGCQSSPGYAPSEEPAAEERIDGSSALVSKKKESSRVKVEITSDGQAVGLFPTTRKEVVRRPAKRKTNPLSRPEKVTTRIRIKPSGYSYDPSSCKLGPTYEIQGIDSGDGKLRAQKERRWRPKLKIELPPPEDEAKKKKLPEPKGQILGTGN